MGEKYLQDDEKEKLKSKLHAYIADKAKRRAGVTSSKAYEGAQEAFGKQEALSDVGAFSSLLSDSAGRMGTVMGKSSVPHGSLGRFGQALSDSSQNTFENMRKLRDMEEGANMNDLRVAGYLSGVDQFDEKKKLEHESNRLKGEENAIKRQELYERMMWERGDKDRRFGLDERRQGAAEEHQRGVRDLYGKGRGPGNPTGMWELLEGPEGEAVLFDRRTGTSRPADGLKGFESKKDKDKKKAAEDKPATESERKAGLQAEISIKELPYLEQLEKDYRPGARDAIAGSIGGALGNYAYSDKGRAYESAAKRILDPMLRAMSGANAPQAEIDAKRESYIIRPGDDDATIQRKLQARREFIEALRASAGRGAQSKLPPPAGGAADGKVRVISPQGVPGSIPADKLEDALNRGYTRAQ